MFSRQKERYEDRFIEVGTIRLASEDILNDSQRSHEQLRLEFGSIALRLLRVRVR